MLFRSRIRKEINSKLILVGDGPELAYAKEIANKLNLCDKIFFLGRKDNVVPLLNSSNLYLLPSKSESFGVSALEALSCSVPVVGTNVGGLKEVVKHGICGYLYDPDDIESLTDASINILSSTDLMEKMSYEARKIALKFDTKIIVPQYIEYYKKIINS